MEKPLKDIAPGTKITWIGLTYIVTAQTKARHIYCQSATTNGGAWLIATEQVKIKN